MKTIPKMESNDFSMFSLEHLDRVSNNPATKSEAVVSLHLIVHAVLKSADVIPHRIFLT